MKRIEQKKLFESLISYNYVITTLTLIAVHDDQSIPEVLFNFCLGVSFINQIVLSHTQSHVIGVGIN